MKTKIIVLCLCTLLIATAIPAVESLKNDARASPGLPSIIGEISQKNDLPQLNEDRPAPLDTDWWPMFGHDTSHSRYSTSTTPDTGGSVLWSYTTGSYLWPSPAVANGKVYAGSWDGKEYCLDASTGGFVWSFATGASVMSSSAVVDGKVYVGSGQVFCLDASTGAKIWSYQPGNWVNSNPTVANGKVYVGSEDHKLYCLDAATGELIWSYTTGDHVDSSPAVVNGKVYVGSNDHNVYCLDAATGGLVWSYTTGNWVSSSPAVVNGKVYIGSGDHKVYCLDASTGGLSWSYTTSYPVSSSPAVANGKVYIGSNDHTVYCLDASTGGLSWSYTTGDIVASSPAVADGKVYIGSYDNKVYCLNAATGGLIWGYTTCGQVFSSPAVANGIIYVGSNDGSVYAFGPDEWPMFGHDTSHSRYSTSTAPNSNNLCWSYTTSGAVLSSPAVTNGKVYVGSNDYKVYCLNAATGSKIWSYTTGGAVRSSPAVTNGKVYVGSNDHKVYCLNAATGELIWSYTTDYSVYSSPAVVYGKVYVGSRDWYMYCLNAATGGLVWSHMCWGWIYSSPAVSDWKVYVATVLQDGGAMKFECSEALTGEIIWGALGWSPDMESSPAVINGKIYIGNTDGPGVTGHNVICLDDATQSVQWDFTADGCVDSSPAVADGKVYVGSDDYNVYCLNAATGAMIWAFTTGGMVYSSPAVADGKVYVGSYDGKVYCFGAQQQNHPPNEPKKPTGPATRVTGQPGTYWANGTDPDGDLIQYRFDWNASGSHSYSSWTSLVNSGTKLSKNHTWTKAGTYVVKVQSKDEHGATSIWSNGLSVTVTGNNPPNKPKKPTGPSTRLAGQAGTYWANGTDPDGDKIQYRFDWDAAGAHAYSSWTSLVNSGTKLSKNHSWTAAGTYVVKVQSKDEHGLTSAWSNGLNVTVTVNHPPNQPKKPTGPTTRNVGQAGTYWANGTDPDGDKIQYRFDWDAAGAHVYSSWTSLVNSGTKLSKQHTWTVPGTYVVKVQSRDEHGVKSVWSNGLTVVVSA